MFTTSTSKLLAIMFTCLFLGSMVGYTFAAYVVYEPQSRKLREDLFNAQVELMVLENRYTQLSLNYSELESRYSILETGYNILKLRWDTIFQAVQENYTSTTLVYYTNYSRNWNCANVHVRYDIYRFYHEEQPHPSISRFNLETARMYITPNEPVIKDIVSTIMSQTASDEELVNALLDLVQYKSYALSNRYYYTPEYKYPVETLVEMGGDCDTHAFLYATLLKAAGFKVLLAFSQNMTHVAVLVHLTDDPKHGTQTSFTYFTYADERYYYAETTNWGWMVGDMPPEWRGQSFYLISV